MSFLNFHACAHAACFFGGNVLPVMNTNTLPRKAPTRPSGFVCPSFLNATEQGGGGVGDGVDVDVGGRNVDVDMSVSDNRRGQSRSLTEHIIEDHAEFWCLCLAIPRVYISDSVDEWYDEDTHESE